MKWSWQLAAWPELTWDASAMESLEAAFLQAAGRAAGAYSHLSDRESEVFQIELLSDEAMQTSRIEGEVLDRASVQSSLRKNFGLQIDRQRAAGYKEQGIADLLAETWQRFSEPLSDATLHDWHGKLMRGQLVDEALGCYRAGNQADADCVGRSIRSGGSFRGAAVEAGSGGNGCVFRLVQRDDSHRNRNCPACT